MNFQEVSDAGVQPQDEKQYFTVKEQINLQILGSHELKMEKVI